MRFSSVATVCVLSLSLTLQGCGISHGQAFSPSQVNSIQKHVTTEGQIRAMFGEPVAVRVNQKRGTKTLFYQYNNDESIQKFAAGLAGAVAGGLLGNQIGGGRGKDIATGVGALAGGALAENAVTTRNESQRLSVVVSLKTGRVIDYDFLHNKGRSQSWSPSSGVSPL